MANYQLLKADIDEKVYENAQQKITGANLNSVLNAMVSTLGAEYQFAGVATKDTNPETTDAKVFYIANGKGTYTNFGGLKVTEDEVVVLYWDTEWHKVSTGIASNEKLTELGQEVSENDAKADTNFDIISGKLMFEQGGMANDGSNTTYNPGKTIRMPSAVQAVAKSFYVPTGYYFQDVFYYSAWTSPSSFTLAERVAPWPQTNIYTIDPTIGAYYRFSIKRMDNGDITPAEIYRGLNLKDETQAEFNRINGVLDETIKKTPQSLNDDEKSIARFNISAAKVAYQTEEKNGLVYIDSDGKALNSDANILDARNIFDVSNAKVGYRLDDSGNEVTDESEVYTTSFIPALGGLSIIGNVAIGKVYCFRQDFSLILRAEGVNANVVMNIKASYNNDVVYWIAFQIKITDYLSAIISAVPNGGTPVLPAGNVQFSIKQGPLPIPAKSLVWKDSYGNFELLTEINSSCPSEIANAVLFSDISPWEPATADSGYSNPTSGWGRDTKRADWSAADKYYYYEFLAHYYDTYLGVYNNGDYKVTKKGLWQDGAHTGHEIFEYDFCPKDYRYVIMLSAGMNADETQGIWGLATFIRALMGEEETNMAIMKRNIRFKVIPIINASGFDEATLRYNYFNGVNPNFNFNYIDSWARHDVPTSEKGDYPDSNYETVMLKKWVNDHSGKAVLWLDLHTGRWDEGLNKFILDVRFSSESAYFNDFNRIHLPLVKKFYLDKGYLTSSDDIGGAISVRDNLDYQKHRYALDICGINSAMPEMHLESTGYGADGFTNNTEAGIKCYVLQIRQIIMYVVNKYIAEKVSTYNLPELDIMMFRNNP